jgi:DNA-directed RNA polymerase III subunit RPC1
VVVAGIPTVERAVISEVRRGQYELLLEGTGLRDVLGTPGVDSRTATTNHVAEVERVLGIEAARSAIMDEVVYTMRGHGMTIDGRHTMLLADCMTYKVCMWQAC